MTELRRDLEISLIIEQLKKGNLTEEVAKRELLLLGCDRTEVQYALGQVQLNG